MSDDTISRKATIDAMEGVDWYHINKGGRLVHGANSKDDEPLYKAKDVYTVLNTMPSAQPETHDKRTKTHSCDLISRKAAMEEISKQQTCKMFEGEDTLYLDANDVGSVLASLPSAQQTLYGYDIEHLKLIANVMQKENLPPERVTEALMDIGRIVAIVRDEFEETLRKAVEQCRI